MRFLHPALNSRYVAVLPAMALSLLWIVLLESQLYLKDPAVTTADFIKSTDKLVQNHVRAWGEVPAGMNELRLFAKQTYNRYATFDVWGERLEYLRLGKINYTIRSFGADGLQNRPGGLLDPGVFRWGQLEKLGLRYDAEEGVKQARPSVVLFAGADDSTANWHAKIFVDPISGMRRLLVRDRRERRFYMIAPHDGVEEFLWVPGYEKIVFTATQSARYDDGVYLWDLRSDEVTNLFGAGIDGSKISPGRRERSFYLALSSISSETPVRVAVFAAPSHGQPLDPDDFFHPKNLHTFEIGEMLNHVLPDAMALKRSSLNSLDFLGSMTVLSGGGGNAQQVAWLRLPMGGEWEKAIMKWQEFAATHGKTQLAPYAIWGLSAFYRQASKQAGTATKNGQIFASYSVELANALNQMPSAPGYARAIGAWIGSHP